MTTLRDKIAGAIHGAYESGNASGIAVNLLRADAVIAVLEEEKPRLKEHKIAKMVNELKEAAIGYHDCQCLRDVILRIVASYIEPGSYTQKLKE